MSPGGEAPLPRAAGEGSGEGAAPPPAPLDVSVVMPTHRRDDTLLRCLEALAGQDYPRDRFEIVVVDDARSESVPRLVAAFAARNPSLSMRVLPGRGQGPATARNIGWRAARGRVIAFIDDDAYPADAHWLARGLAPFADDRVMGVSGSVHVPVDHPPTDFQRNVQGLERGEFVTCNAFYRRAALERVGGFDEAFTMPFREDSDLQYRVEDAGGVMVHAPDARVIHPAAPGRFAISLRLQRYSQFNALLYKKHPERFRRLLEPRPPLHYYGIIAAACTGMLAAITGRRTLAIASLTAWGVLEARFFGRRVRGTSRRPRHLLDLALTSLLIPWLSIYWRLRGALRYRVPFW